MATLVDIVIVPLSPVVIIGQTTQLQAIGSYDDDTQVDITTSVDWASADTDVATVGLHTGLVTGVSYPSVQITATLGSITASTLITVNDGALVSIAVTPSTPSKIKGTTQQLGATGTYQSGITSDLSASATWVSSNHAACTIAAGGLATAVDVGTSNVTATYGGVTSPVIVFTTHNNLVSIDVTPNAPTKHKGQTQQMTATGTYEDSSTANITSSVTWASATPAKATVSSSGLVTAVAVGTSVISATSGLISGNETVTIDAATVVSVAVTPASPTVINGATQQMTAMATYTDATVVDKTATATWASATPAKATVSVTGLVTGVADGTSVVGATVDGVEGHTTVTSTKGSLVSLAITAASSTIVQGATDQLAATGTYQDGSTANLTTTVSWLSDSASATVGLHTGLVTGVHGGLSTNPTISAHLEPVSASKVITITDPAPIANAYHEVDVATLDTTLWTAQSMGIMNDWQGLWNDSTTTVEFSFDGVNRHGKLKAGGTVEFNQTRATIYLRAPSAGTGTFNIFVKNPTLSRSMAL